MPYSRNRWLFRACQAQKFSLCPENKSPHGLLHPWQSCRNTWVRNISPWLTDFFLSDFSDIIRKAQMTWLFEKACFFPLCWHICSSPSHYICVTDLLHLFWKKGLSEIRKWKLSQGPTLILKMTQLPQTPSHRLLKNVVVWNDLPSTSGVWQTVCREIPSTYKACFF